MLRRFTRSVIIFIILFHSYVYASSASLNDPLPSWHDHAIKKAIIDFVQTVTDTTNKDYVPPEDRIATIDNDGTLWVEQPIYTQMIFIMDRIKALAHTHPEWQHLEPYQSILHHQAEHLNAANLEHLFAVTSQGLSTKEYISLIKKWLATAENPHFKKHYTELIYQPMLEVIHYLHEHHFMVYIVSGGGQDFIRAFSPTIYHIPLERIIGSSSQTQYLYQHHAAHLIKIPKPLLICNNEGKPEAIHLFIGKKPIIAFGNSDGDRQMLEWTQSGKGKHLMLLVHHDDGKREYAYDIHSKIGTFSKSLFREAKKQHWHIISMKNDWKVIFPFER